jgi:hypothetical protein
MAKFTSQNFHVFVIFAVTMCLHNHPIHFIFKSLKEYPSMARTKSPSGKGKKEKDGVNVPVIPNGNPVTTEALAADANHEAVATPKAAAAAAGVTTQAVIIPEARKFEVHKSESRNKVVPINVEEEIRRRAYELFQQRGQGTGSAAEDWLAAEREVMQRYRQQPA